MTNKINTIEDAKKLYPNEINWWEMCTECSLSESFMREFVNEVDWLLISKYQELSEDFIEEFFDIHLDSCYTIMYQKLSREFLIKHLDEIRLLYLEKNEKIADEVKEEIEMLLNLIYER